ncbi:hypothetical protein MPSEU_000706900 [Mayamaea pseudoterrestris]|nr:hypothetical protein MPSEU_000706900 [Mayamaea pseudoterrestris]
MTMGPWQVLVFLLAASCTIVNTTPIARPYETIVSSECSVSHRKNYGVRLDITYLYLIEWHADSNLDLEGVERAIASELVDMLDECDAFDRPKYAVQVFKGVEASKKEGDCSSRQGNSTECRVFRGTTSILFDRRTDVDEVEQMAYFVIGGALNEPASLQSQTTMHITRAELLQPIGDNLVILTTDSDENNAEQKSAASSSVVVRAALASAAVSFAITVGLAYLMCIRRRAAARDKSDGKLGMFKLHTKHRQFFQELHDEESNNGLEPGWMVTDTNVRSPSVTWSVSDLTSDSLDDSQSIRSTLPLDRIIEAIFDEELGSNESAHSMSGEPGERDQCFIPRWDGEVSESESIGVQCLTPPHKAPFRCEHVSGTIVEVSPSLSPSTPPSTESVIGRNLAQDLDSVAVSLEGCQYLENDVETSDEVDCSFNSDPTYGLDVPVCTLGPVDVRKENLLDITPDDDLLFSDDDLDMMEVGENVWSVDDGYEHSQDCAVVAMGKVKSAPLNDNDAAQRQLSHAIEERLERVKVQQLLVNADEQ